MITINELSDTNLQDAINFLLPYEYNCVSLTSRLINNNKPCLPPKDNDVYVFYQDEKIIGIILLTSNGLCLHNFPFLLKSQNIQPDFIDALAKIISKLLADKTLYCISGEALGSQFIQNICWQKPKTIIDYEIRFFDNSNTPATNFLTDANTSEIVRCKPSDAGDLFQLQKGYDIEEVIPPGDKFYEIACRKKLTESLNTQMIFAIKQKNSFVAKAGTNAIGFNWCQIGGVYTLPQYRSCGMAATLVSKTTQTVLANGKSVMLFVKLNNESAKRAYTKAGFVPAGFYKIIYYNIY